MHKLNGNVNLQPMGEFCVASSEGNKRKTPIKAKEASNKERSLIRMQEQAIPRRLRRLTNNCWDLYRPMPRPPSKLGELYDHNGDKQRAHHYHFDVSSHGVPKILGNMCKIIMYRVLSPLLPRKLARHWLTGFLLHRDAGRRKGIADATQQLQVVQDGRRLSPQEWTRTRNFVLQDWIEPIPDIQEHIDDITRAANSKIPIDT